MSEAFTDLLDHCIDLMHGSVTGVDRSIESGKFKYVDDPIEVHLATASGAPYPFEFQPESFVYNWPEGIDNTASLSRSYRSASFSIRVGYAQRPHQQRNLIKDMYRDVYRIRRTIGDPDSWVSEASFLNVNLGSSSSQIVSIPGEADIIGLMYVVTTDIELVFSEDYS